MSQRITEQMLTDAVARLNRTLDVMSFDEFEWESAYGKYRVTSNRGSVNRSPLGTKRETYNWITTYCEGVEEALLAVASRTVKEKLSRNRRMRERRLASTKH